MSKLPLRWMVIGLILLLPSFLHAQEKSISGTVSSSGTPSFPLEGVSVKIKGSDRGTSTNAAGRFQITVPANATLVFTSIGYRTREVKVGSSTTLNVLLEQSESAMEEVVVTSLGIKKSKRELGYTVTEIKGQDVAQTQRDNFLMGLAGRVPGANITATSGMPGASVNINLRGITSITSNNSPLFVIDGVPVDNRTLSSGALVADRNTASSISNRSIDFGNRIGDLNPDDIESITVLKGPEAAALYGMDAGNGVIMITTKKGKAGTGRLNYSSNFTMEKVQRLPTIQRTYGRGLNGEANTATLSYFGPAYNNETPLYDNINSFFQTGTAQRHNLSLDGGNATTTYRLSGAYATRKGVIPSTRYDRLNIGLTATQKIGKIASVEANLQYINTQNDKVSKGQNSFMLGLLQWPSDDDITDYLTAAGTRKTFTALTTEIENPFFDVNKNKLWDQTNRFIGNFFINVTPTDWLTLSARIGADVYGAEYNVMYHPESNRARTFGGAYDIAQDNFKQFSGQYYATAKKKFLQNKLAVTARLGGVNFDRLSKVLATRGTNFLDPNFISMNNTRVETQRSATTQTQVRRVSAFGELTLGYQDLFFYTYTARNDWSSTLPENNNSFFYDAHLFSFVFSDLDKGGKIFGNVLSYGKARFALSRVGKDALPYRVQPAYEAQTTTGGGFSYGFTAPNPALRPEFVKSFEVGAELGFFNDRLTFDAAYYKKTTTDQIISGLRISYGSGFILKTINGGELYNKGLELTLSGVPIKKKNFTWNVSVNYNAIRSELVRLSDQISEFYDSDTWLYSNVRNGIRVGGPLTTFTGNSFVRNNAGQILINPTSGLPVTTTTNPWAIVGDRNPRYMMGVTNSFTVKNFSLSFLLDIRRGGDVYNATELFLYRNGLSNKTLDRFTPRIFEGVLNDGLQNSPTPTPNNIQITPYYNSNYYSLGFADEMFIERNIHWLRLRDVTVSYNLPNAWLKKTKSVRSARIYATATDLFMLTNYSGGDPGVNGTTAASGGSGGSGFDYGNLPLPKVFNLGLSVSF